MKPQDGLEISASEGSLPPDHLTPVWAKDLLERCEFPSASQGPVTLAVSGGPDSLALTVLASAAGLGGRVVHVDHGLRPSSADDAIVVKEASEQYGFDFELLTVDVGQGPDLEARARLARYSALPPGVLTGHTMDDLAETVLLNLLRGAGIDGLAAMRRTSAARVRRPILGLRRTETERLCRICGLIPVHDETNTDIRFRRNRVRAEVIPLLDEVAGRDLVPLLARQASLLADEAYLLDSLADGIDPRDVRSLRAAARPLARRAIRVWLRAASSGADAELHPPSLAEVERVLGVVEGRAKACEISGGRRVERSRGKLHLRPPSRIADLPAEAASLQLPIPAEQPGPTGR